MNGILEFFRKIIQEGWIPKALVDKKYKMYPSVKIAIDALLAMVED